MTFTIRLFHPTDLPSLYRICLETADNGADASGLYSDYDLHGHMYAAPYAHYEPDLCFVLTKDAMPVGYCLGTRDSAEFYQRTERDWFPELRKRYPLNDQPADRTEWDRQLINYIHEGIEPDPGLEEYPAHLHIDILPVGQKHGFGRKLIDSLIDQLRADKVPGLHLGVTKQNLNAIAFYTHFGFQPLHDYPQVIIFGMKL